MKRIQLRACIITYDIRITLLAKAILMKAFFTFLEAFNCSYTEEKYGHTIFL